ncbi:MAG: triple tyrosine motif-containing protein [Thermoanaerobaculia bacterium]|nr:triple tyrosine motif-containing protein [Thermoanaerobaculia bacterium]
MDPIAATQGQVRALLVESDGTVLVGHQGGLARRAPDGGWSEIRLRPIEPPVSGLARAGDELWVGAANGFWRRSGDGWHQIEASREVNPRVAADPSGEVWLWSGDRGVRRFRDGRLESVPELAGTDRLVFTVVPDGERTVWLGIGGEGLLRLRRPLIGALSRDDGLPARAVHGIVQGHDGSLWIGSLGSGLTRVAAGIVEVFDEGDGLPSSTVTWLAEAADGRIVVGTNRGPAIGGPAGFVPWPELAAVESERARISLFYPQRDGTALVASAASLYRLSGGRVEIVAERLFESGAIEVALRDRRGDLWIGGLGVCRLGTDGRRCFSEEDGLPPHLVRTIFETPSGELLFGTYGGGLCRFEDAVFACLSEDRGLPHRTVHDILLDELGWAWLPSNRGLGRVRLEELERAFDDPSLLLSADVFGLEDGLPDLEFNGGVPPAGVRLEDGRLALPTMGGVVVVDPARAAAVSAEPPIAHLESVVADGNELSVAAARQLPAGLDRITFRYTAIHPRAGSVRFRYRLEGHDRTWQPAGAARSVSYTGLAPGDYLFRLQARAGGSPWSDEVAALFELPPFFWQTGWFLGLVALLGAVGLYALYRLRMARLLELERVRLGIASDLHDELSGELSAIALSSAIARRRGYLERAERDRLSEIESTAREVITGLRDLVWAIDPEHDTLAATVARLRSAAAQLLDGLEWSFEEEWTSTDDGLSMSARRDLYLTVKEALTNAVRHAGAARVDVRLERSDGRLVATVADDGCGFDPAEVAGGSGLASMRRRAERIGGRLSIESSPDRGAIVRLVVPLGRLSRSGENSGWWRRWRQA